MSIVTLMETGDIDEIEVLDELEESCNPKKEGDEKKWIVINETIDHKRQDELLKEVEYLKNMVIDMHKLMTTQNENVTKLGDTVYKMNESMVLISSKEKIPYTKYSYVKYYLFPALRIAGTYTPFLMLMAARTGIAASTLSFLFCKIFS